MYKRKTETEEAAACSLQENSLKTRIEKLIDSMNPANYLQLQPEVARLKIKLRAMRRDVDFTMKNQSDYGVRVIESVKLNFNKP